MKIEIGESLLQSYLKYEKGCLVTQTNWKTSSLWQIADEDYQNIKAVFDKIHNHNDFSDVFKNSSLEQALKQAELDVVGINNDKLYMVEVAFHENGLQYGDKSETKDRVCKKLLRAYLIGLAFFPNFTYEIIFASPKVNPATDQIIKEYFAVLEKDFGDADSDTSELFIRSAKMLDIFGVLDLNSSKKERIYRPKNNNQNENSDTLLRDLRTVGFSTFVEYYEYYANPKYDTGDIRALLIKSGKYKINSCNTKASVGKRIINKGLGHEALKIIANANNIDSSIINKAKSLL